MKQALEQWLLMLNKREKLMVFGGLAVAVLILLWGFVWEPLKTRNTELEAQIQDRKNELRWMQMAQAKILQAQKNPVASRPVAPANPSQAVDAALQRYQLKQGLKRMQGNNEISLTLNNVNVDQVMQFLGELETKRGLTVLKMNITPLDKKGGIDATLRLGKS